MRELISGAAVVGALAMSACAQAGGGPAGQPVAVAAQGYGTPATASTPFAPHGYSDADRRMADCLAAEAAQNAAAQASPRPGALGRCQP